MESAVRKLSVAVIGAGPSGIYACEELLKSTDPEVTVDLFDALPTPFGLVRYGVAPDHQKIKNVTAVFDKILDHERLRFHGNVRVNQPELDWMRHRNHAVVVTVGASSDRRLGIPGEDLPGSYSATDFVAWYNGHPDMAAARFLLDQPRAVVVGVGNVALDVARVLLSPPQRLAQTDIADVALQALQTSQVREVVLLARRGPAQAAFTNPELRELLEDEDLSLEIRPHELDLDPSTRAALEREPDKMVAKRLELLAGARVRPQASRRLVLRFLVSPLEISGSDRVERVTLGRNQLGENLSARLTEEREELPTGAVFRSIGYRGLPLGDLPYDERSGTLRNSAGRITGESGEWLPGFYTAGWIKRGPTGVIGTNRLCAKETVAGLLADAREGRLPDPAGSRESWPHPHVDLSGWRRLDEHEQSLGTTSGRPRVKVTSRADMLRHAGAEGIALR